MRYIIDEGKMGFFPMLMENNDIIVFDCSIARILDLTLEEYIELVIQNSGFESINDFYFFRTKEECQEFIDKIIEPRLVMKKLIE